MPENLIVDLEAIKRSSGFRIGSFSVPMGDAGSLPGRKDPAGMYDSLGIKEIDGLVASIFCESGGLLTEALNRGSTRVIGFEDRYWSVEALEIVKKNHPQGQLIGVGGKMPYEFKEEDLVNVLGKCSVVFMTEGWQNFCRYPLKLIKSAYSFVKDGGMLVFELVEGKERAPSEPTNAWYPSIQAFKNCLKDLCGPEPVEVLTGKLEGRFICRLRKPIVTIDGVESEDDIVVVDDSDPSEDDKPKEKSEVTEDPKGEPAPEDDRPEEKAEVTEDPKGEPVSDAPTDKSKDPVAVARGKKAWETRMKNKAAKEAAALNVSEKQQE